MGENGYMEDSINDIESNVYTYYLHMSNENDSLEKRAEKISTFFPSLTLDEIIKILIKLTFNGSENNVKNETEYLESLSTKELDSLYFTLVRNLGNKEKTEIISQIEQIIANRV